MMSSLRNIAACAALILPLAARAQPCVLANQVVVRLHPNHNISAVAATFGGTIAGEVPSRDLYLLQFSMAGGGPPPIAGLLADERVAWVEMNFVQVAPGGGTQSFFVGCSTSTYVNQYALVLIGAPAAQQLSLGAGATVAVLDTGVSPELVPIGMQVLPGFNVIENNTNTADVGNGLDDDSDGLIDELVGHGTFVSGVVATVAPAAALLPVKVLNSDGVGASFYTAKGVYQAIESGADVINLSLQSIKYSHAVDEAVQEATAAGILVVASVGNTGQQFPAPYPAALPDVVAVAATDAHDLKAASSCYGEYVDLTAPGVDVVSVIPAGGYALADGTSFAAAFVSGAAALVRPLLGPPNGADLRAALFDTARDLNALNPQYASLLGHGRVDVHAAAVLASATICDCNLDGALTVADFGCFQTRFLSGDPYADCDGNGALAVADFSCFQTAFVLGCQ